MLGIDPRPSGVTSSSSSRSGGSKVGDQRVIYLIDDPDRVAAVLRVARRSESTYRRRA
jgi:mRNA-degrading endonuclease RelE of RelBE toxin-antitoxin system